jgi:subtilisin family serine protease
MRRAAFLALILAAACPALLAVAQAAPVRASAPGTVVAVLDTGVSAFAPELRGRLLPGADLVDGDGRPADANGHGTAVAATVAAACPSCRILPVRVLSRAGTAPWSRVAAGIVWAADHGARVVNVSIAGSSGSMQLRDAVAYAAKRGVVVVAAAGNTGETRPQYPAAYPTVLGVAATRGSGVLADWSARGSWVDLAAPGCGSLPLDPATHAWACGTSFAAPRVAGAAALLLSREPELRPAALHTRLAGLVSTHTPVAPAIRVSGAARAGSTLRAAATGVPRGVHVRWYRCAPSGSVHDCDLASTGPAYRVRAADRGLRLVARAATEPFGGLWLTASAPRRVAAT